MTKKEIMDKFTKEYCQACAGVDFDENIAKEFEQLIASAEVECSGEFVGMTEEGRILINDSIEVKQYEFWYEHLPNRSVPRFSVYED